ncbi:aa3-type cytochrome c oxidase subunit IV [Beijerinckia indica]|nr:aa3-type cytochrome c oxidase subunit IV [Beijerinckia indica]
MSANPAVGGIPAMDYPEHERTYQRFISMVKVTIVGSILLLVVLALVTL